MRQLPLAEKAPDFADYLAQRAIPLGSETHNGKKVATWSQGFGERERKTIKKVRILSITARLRIAHDYTELCKVGIPSVKGNPTHHHSFIVQVHLRENPQRNR